MIHRFLFVGRHAWGSLSRVLGLANAAVSIARTSSAFVTVRLTWQRGLSLL
jgi:hypothetical protein